MSPKTMLDASPVTIRRTVVKAAEQHAEDAGDGEHMLGMGSPGETGYGISSFVGDGDRQVLTVNVPEQAIDVTAGFTGLKRRYTFQEFVEEFVS